MKITTKRRTQLSSSRRKRDSPLYENLEQRRMLSCSHGIQVTDSAIITCHDTIPRFVSDPTDTAIQSGNWSDPSIWADGTVPVSTDLVRVNDGVDVRFDISTEIDSLEINGQLEFSTDIDTSLLVTTITVLPGGGLTIGTPENPVADAVSAEIVFRDTPLQTGSVEHPGLDPSQYGNGLIVLGSIDVHGADKTAYTRATQDIDSGATEVSLENVPLDWRSGDTLLLPETSQTPQFNNGIELTETELLELDSVGNGKVTFTTAAKNNHLGISENPFDVERYAHVANLTRNVIFQSENPLGVRGHLMATATAQVDVNGAAFIGLGRTSADSQLDNSIIEDGNLLHIGENQKGRYSLHIHHVASEEVNIADSVVSDGLKWGITIHATNYANVENNIIYDVDGAGFVTENGTEIGTVVQGNLVAKIDGGHQTDNKRGGAEKTLAADGTSFVEFGNDGSAFWLRATAGTYTSNVVYDSVGYGFNFNGYYNRVASSDLLQVDLFDGNEVVSSKGGLWLTWSQGQSNISEGYQQQTFKNLLAWHVDTDGVLAYHDGNFSLESITVIGNPAISSINEGSHFILGYRSTRGINLGNPSYENFDIDLSDIKISGTNVGILAPVNSGEEGGTLNNATLANYVNLAYVNGADLDDLDYSGVEFLPSPVLRIAESYPVTVANVFQEDVGIIFPGTLDPDAGNGILPTLPPAFDLRSDGELRIKGGAGNDSVRITYTGDLVSINSNGASVDFSPELVNRILFFAYAGDDVFINETSISSRIFGGDGDDVLVGGSGGDSIQGGAGNDTISGGDGNDVIYAGEGDDIVEGGDGSDKIRGGEGNDTIDGGLADDPLLDGGSGDDVIKGGFGRDVLIGGLGNDKLSGGEGNDSLVGGEGNDFLYGGIGDDTLYGGEGIDHIYGDKGKDKIRSGLERDYVFADVDDILFTNDGEEDEVVWV